MEHVEKIYYNKQTVYLGIKKVFYTPPSNKIGFCERKFGFFTNFKILCRLISLFFRHAPFM